MKKLHRKYYPVHFEHVKSFLLLLLTQPAPARPEIGN